MYRMCFTYSLLANPSQKFRAFTVKPGWKHRWGSSWAGVKLAAVEEADALLMLSRFSDLPLISEVLIRTHIFHIYNNNDTYTNYVTQKRRSILAVFEQILLAGTMETRDHE